MATKEEAKIDTEGLTKVKYPDYYTVKRMREDLKNEIMVRVANKADGLMTLAEEYRGRRGCHKMEIQLLNTFISEDGGVEAKVQIPGLGTYRAELADVRVAMNNDKEPCPFVEIFVRRGDGVEFEDNDPDSYFDGCWGFTLMDAIDSLVNKLFEALEWQYRKDFYALPEELREG